MPFPFDVVAAAFCPQITRLCRAALSSIGEPLPHAYISYCSILTDLFSLSFVLIADLSPSVVLRGCCQLRQYLLLTLGAFDNSACLSISDGKSSPEPHSMTKIIACRQWKAREGENQNAKTKAKGESESEKAKKRTRSYLTDQIGNEKLFLISDPISDRNKIGSEQDRIGTGLDRNRIGSEMRGLFLGSECESERK